MKLFIVAGVAALVSVSQLPAKALGTAPPSTESQMSLGDAAGQPVYDLSDGYVGTIRRVVDDRGDQAAIIVNDKDPASRPHAVVASAQDLAPRADGGWLLELSAGSVAELPRYFPGQPLPSLFM